jgi:hypothetical protein
VVHHSASSPNLTIEDIHQMHLNLGWICVGYHAIILRDGTIQYGRPMEFQGAQTQGYNDKSLGVCLIGYFHKDSVNQGQYPDKPTDEQLTSLVEVLTNWKKKIPQKVEIVGHRQLNSTSCPGDGISHLTIEGIAKKVDNAIKHEIPTTIPIPIKDKHYTELVQKYATQYNLRVEFVHSIIKQESDYNPKAVSKSGAMGLMQILPSTYADMAKRLDMENSDPFLPENNIRIGCSYLAWCKVNLDLEWCIACGYNQGIGHFKRGTMPIDGLKYANEVKKRIYSE